MSEVKSQRLKVSLWRRLVVVDHAWEDKAFVMTMKEADALRVAIGQILEDYQREQNETNEEEK